MIVARAQLDTFVSTMILESGFQYTKTSTNIKVLFKVLKAS